MMINTRQHIASAAFPALSSSNAVRGVVRSLLASNTNGGKNNSHMHLTINSVPHIWSDPMKRILTASVLCMLIAVSLRAGQAITSVSASAKQVTMTMFGQPQKAEAKLLPFVEGQLLSGKRERFGVQFGGVPTTTTIVEILGPSNSVIKAMSLNELLGNGTRGAITSRGSSVLSGRRIETIYDVPAQGGTIQLVLRAIVTGDDDGAGAGQQLVVSFSLKSPTSLTAGLRLSLPVAGTPEQTEHGFAITPKGGGAALAASIFPFTATASVQKNRLVLTSPVASTSSSGDVPQLWFVMSAFSGTGAKAEAGTWLRSSAPAPDDPRVVIVSSVDKKVTQPRDTVTYTLIVANIGTGTANDISLNNPIPKGTRYLEQTATANGLTVSFARAGGSPKGEVSSITWKTPQPVVAGEERIVSFKVIVQ
jgi:uncharacterized repeat protein (TIGR01451 family)